MKYFFIQILILVCGVAATTPSAVAGKPYTKYLDGYIKSIGKGFDNPEIGVNVEGKVSRVAIDKDTLIKKKGEILKYGDLKVGDKVYVSVMTQDGKTIFTSVDVS